MDSSGPDNASFESSNATARKNDGSRTNSYRSHTLHDGGSGEGKLNNAVEVLRTHALPQVSSLQEYLFDLSGKIPPI
jgi:hypothetical protein